MQMLVVVRDRLSVRHARTCGIIYAVVADVWRGRKEGREDIFLDINCSEEGDVRPPPYSVSATLLARCPVHLGVMIY